MDYGERQREMTGGWGNDKGMRPEICSKAWQLESVLVVSVTSFLIKAKNVDA